MPDHLQQQPQHTGMLHYSSQESNFEVHPSSSDSQYYPEHYDDNYQVIDLNPTSLFLNTLLGTLLCWVTQWLRYRFRDHNIWKSNLLTVM